jgi:hypothetical protein
LLICKLNITKTVLEWFDSFMNSIYVCRQIGVPPFTTYLTIHGLLVKGGTHSLLVHKMCTCFCDCVWFLSDAEASNINQTQSHKVVHERKKPHKCTICDYRFTTEGNLNSHTDTIHEGFNNYGLINLIIS